VLKDVRMNADIIMHSYKYRKLIEVGRGYGVEINIEKTKAMRISRQPTH
jgi:hypothetical protein